jgi:hypothetical protein
VAVSDTVQMQGHLLDDGMLARTLDEILGTGADYVIERFDVGKHPEDESFVRITVSAEDEESLGHLLGRLQAFGANLTTPGELSLVAAEMDGVFPEDFYSSTNLETEVFLEGRWVRVPNPEMDCGLVVSGGVARTVPMISIRAGDLVVCGANGVRVVLPPREAKDESTFEFMNSVVSSEKAAGCRCQIADDLRAVKAISASCGRRAGDRAPVAPAMAALVPRGLLASLRRTRWPPRHRVVDVRHAGLDLSHGSGVEHGHEHHIRAINRIRRCGSIAGAGRTGVLTGGSCMRSSRPASRSLAGSVRDDGPLPDAHRRDRGQQAARVARGRRLRDHGGLVLHATTGNTGLDPGLRRHEPGHGDQAQRPGLRAGRRRRHRHRAVHGAAGRRARRRLPQLRPASAGPS